MRKRFIFRVSEEMYDEVNDAVKQGVAQDTSDLIRLAVEKFFKEGPT